MNRILKNINIPIYYKTQEKLIYYVQNYLIERDVHFIYYNGNIVSLRYRNRPVFVAHMDTINDKALINQLYVDRNQNILYRKNSILGADDRAGVNLILNHCKNINFILTVDEEMGGIGISQLVNETSLLEELLEYSCCIELDRKGTQDILGSVHGYCEKDLDDAIQNILPSYKSVSGIFTDIDYLYEYIACVNISVGYYNQHTINEYLDMNHYNYINSKIIALSNISNHFDVSTYKFPNYNAYKGGDEDWKDWWKKHYNQYDEYDDYNNYYNQHDY